MSWHDDTGNPQDALYSPDITTARFERGKKWTWLGFYRINDVSSDDRCFFNKADAGESDNQVYCRLSTSNVITISIGGSFQNGGSLSYTQGTWFLLSVMCDGDNIANDIHINIFDMNGDVLRIQDDHTHGGDVTNLATPIWLGTRSTEYDEWDGDMAYIAYVNASLSVNQIHAYRKNPSRMINLWKHTYGVEFFLPMHGPTIEGCGVDHSGNGNNFSNVGSSQSVGDQPPVPAYSRRVKHTPNLVSTSDYSVTAGALSLSLSLPDSTTLVEESAALLSLNLAQFSVTEEITGTPSNLNLNLSILANGESDIGSNANTLSLTINSQAATEEIDYVVNSKSITITQNSSSEEIDYDANSLSLNINPKTSDGGVEYTVNGQAITLNLQSAVEEISYTANTKALSISQNSADEDIEYTTGSLTLTLAILTATAGSGSFENVNANLLQLVLAPQTPDSGIESNSSTLTLVLTSQTANTEVGSQTNKMTLVLSTLTSTEEVSPSLNSQSLNLSIKQYDSINSSSTINISSPLSLVLNILTPTVGAGGASAPSSYHKVVFRLIESFSSKTINED